jgi:hypothetical protein
MLAAAMPAYFSSLILETADGELLGSEVSYRKHFIKQF